MKDQPPEMKHPKRQHYVPQLYLRQFAAVRGAKNPQIYSLDKTNQRVHRTSIRNVAAELHFYERSDRGIEKALQRLEDLFVEPYRRLLTIETPKDLTTEEVGAIVVFLAVQWIRTREHRETIKSTTVEMEKAMKASGAECDPALTDISEDTLRRLHVHGISGLTEHASAIMLQMKWILCTNRSPMPLWTSDNPIALHNSRPAGLVGSLGLMCRGIELYFPLSPTRSLCLCDPTDLGADPAAITSRDINHAWYQNDLQVRNSTRFVFANNGDFAFAKRILGEYPEFANPDRQRMRAD